MNIFRVFSTILYPLFVYVLLFSRRNLVESTGAGASPIPGSGTKTGVDLSLKATAATNEFDYNRSGKTITYTAKDSYGFKSVKTGKNGDIVVWSTDNASEYATKVVLNGKGKKQKEVTIHLPNNTTKVFDRSAKGKPWNVVSQNSIQATGQPGSGTAAPGSNGMTGVVSQGGDGMTGGEGMRGGGYTMQTSNESSETHTRTGSGPVTTPPASSGGDGSTQVTTPATNLCGSTPPPSSGGQSSNNLSGGSSASGELKLFKDDGNGNPVEMVEADYERGNVFGCDTYNTKAGVNCTLVKFDDKDVWKKGEQGVDHASSVTYNSRTNNIVVSNGKKLVYYNKNSTGNLVHIRTIDSSRD